MGAEAAVMLLQAAQVLLEPTGVQGTRPIPTELQEVSAGWALEQEGLRLSALTGLEMLGVTEDSRPETPALLEAWARSS